MDDSEFVLALPKVQLHCHLEGTLRPATFLDLAHRYDIHLGARSNLSAAEVYRFATFGEFLLLFADVCRALRTPDDFARLLREFIADARAQSVRHAEIFVSPSVWTYFHRDLDVEAVFAAMRDVVDERDQGLSLSFVCDLTRNFGPERALQTARLAARLQPYGVVAIGLGGDEANFPPSRYAEAFDFARSAGLHAVAHAGEAAGAASVRDAVEILGAERIGHGVRAREDADVMRLLAERQIPVEMCPTSNALTGCVPLGEPHPLHEFDARGIPVVIDADDPALFDTSVVAEYALAARFMSRTDLIRLARNGIEASFASEARKTALRAGLDSFASNGAA